MWIMVCYTEPEVDNHSVFYWDSGCESWWAMPRSVCRNHGVLCWASRCESLWALLNQWLWIMVCYSVTIHESHLLAQNKTLWFTTTASGYIAMVHTYWHIITDSDSQPLAQHSHRDSQPLAQNNTSWYPHIWVSIAHWFTTTGLA
jgi:hypothetical protein